MSRLRRTLIYRSASRRITRARRSGKLRTGRRLIGPAPFYLLGRRSNARDFRQRLLLVGRRHQRIPEAVPRGGAALLPPPAAPRRQAIVFERTIAMVDTLDAEHVEGLPDIARRPFFTGMRGQKEPRVAGAAGKAVTFAPGA